MNDSAGRNDYPLGFQGLPYLSRMSMRFHPNRRESSDHTPGPIMDSAAPIVVRRILPQGSPDWAMKAHNAAAETMHPETGVHKPTAKSAPAIIAANCTIAGSCGWALSSPRKAKLKTAPQATSRKIRRPAPGQPCANVEKRRRKRCPLLSVADGDNPTKPRQGQSTTLLGRTLTPRTAVSTG